MTGIDSVDCTLANNPDVPIIDLTIVANNRAVILCTDSVNSQNKIECHSDPVRGKTMVLQIMLACWKFLESGQ